MNFNQFTIKAQEAVQEAVNLTQARGSKPSNLYTYFKA